MTTQFQSYHAIPVHGNQPDLKDRRRSVRYPCNLATSQHLVAVVDAVGGVSKVRNISVDGISLIVSRRLDPEAIVNLQLVNRGRLFGCQVPMRVVYVLDHPEGDFIVGGAFTRELSVEEVMGLL